MIKLFIILSFLVTLFVGCSRYPYAANIPLNESYNSFLEKILFSRTATQPISKKWITYGKTSYGDLKGFLLLPEGTGPFPAIIFNHGSKQQPESKRAVSKFFNDLGYAVFLPYRRGYGNSAGTSLDEALTLNPTTNEGKQQLIDRIRQESDDVLSAFYYIKSQTFVDSKRIIISGYSFGGSSTLIVSSKTSEFVAGVAFTTASGIWRYGGIVRQELIAAVRESKVPLMFVYAENDYDISPGIVFSREMRRVGKPVSLRIYPAFGESEQDAHEIAIRPEGIKIWGQDVVNFINKWMPSPKD